MNKLKTFFITAGLALAVLACSLTEQTQAGGLVMAESLPTQTQMTPATARINGAKTATSQPACVITTGVTGGHVNLRSCAGMGCAVITVLSDGDSLAVISGGDWPQVRTADNLTGYVNSKFVTCKAGE